MIDHRPSGSPRRRQRLTLNLRRGSTGYFWETAGGEALREGYADPWEALSDLVGWSSSHPSEPA